MKTTFIYLFIHLFLFICVQRKGARVTFQNGEQPKELASNSSHKLRPLLGYDWIAGTPF